MKYKIFFAIAFMIFLVGIVSAETSYCCEKTINNAWCQNDMEVNCDPAFQSAPTHCDSTDYCRRGCCFNSNEGTCLPNTAEATCTNGGTWEDSENCDIPQCDLGCCLIGEQATFVTQTRCKRLSALYGIGINFRKNIQNEFECVSTSSLQEKGACVFEDTEFFERTCTISTREDCITRGADTEFYAGHLCSDENLNTICGPSDETTCVEGKDQVYYLDTCGNLANIYDSTKRLDTNYWTLMKNIDESCGVDSANGNAGSDSCGNCDYFLGSTCKEYDNNQDPNRPEKGDYVCRDLSCDYEGETYRHGERWCAIDGGVSTVDLTDGIPNTDAATENLPGSRYYRLTCYNGEVTVEPCAEYRAEICIQDKVADDFRTAICRVNRWGECFAQTKEDDCLDDEERDCKWMNGQCIPRYPPGFDLEDSSEDAEDICARGNAQCVIEYQKILGKWECKDNCNCEKAAWRNSKNNFCASLGDCGSGISYLDLPGYYSVGDLFSLSGRLDDESEVEDELEG